MNTSHVCASSLFVYVRFASVCVSTGLPCLQWHRHNISSSHGAKQDHWCSVLLPWSQLVSVLIPHICFHDVFAECHDVFRLLFQGTNRHLCEASALLRWAFKQPFCFPPFSVKGVSFVQVLSCAPPQHTRLASVRFPSLARISYLQSSPGPPGRTKSRSDERTITMWMNLCSCPWKLTWGCWGCSGNWADVSSGISLGRWFEGCAHKRNMIVTNSDQTHHDIADCHFRCFIDKAVVNQHPNLNKTIHFYSTFLANRASLIFTVPQNVTHNNKTMHPNCSDVFWLHKIRVKTCSNCHKVVHFFNCFQPPVRFPPRASEPTTNKLTLLPRASAGIFDEHALGRAGQ